MLSLSVQSQSFTSSEEKSELKADPWTLVQNIKNRLQVDTGVVAAKQRLFFKGKELKNAHTLDDSGITNDAVLYMSLVQHPAESLSSDLVALHVYGNCPCPAAFEEKIHQARQGLAAGLAPRLATEGTGGTYFLRNPKQQRNVAVFKPADEEPFAPDNPRGFTGAMGSEGLKPGVLSGEGHVREVAAFLLDHQHFSGVPATVLAELSHPALNHQRKRTSFDANSGMSNGYYNNSSASCLKVGSLQDYVDYTDMVSDMAPQKFKPAQVHKIAILDIRIVNTDRNDANILVKQRGKGSYDLIPIDHAYSLPDTLQLAWTDWVWYDWPQAKVPLDEETKRYVLSLDINRDMELLRTHLSIREPCLRLMRITNMLLQKGVAAGLTLHEIASIILRHDNENKPSELEIMCGQASEIARKIRDSVAVAPSVRYVSSTNNRASNGEVDSLARITLHRSISHTNFQKVDNMMSKRGFLFASLDGKRQRRKLSVGHRDRNNHQLEPDSPELYSSSSSSSSSNSASSSSSPSGHKSAAATGEIFFNFLERLMDQTIMMYVSKQHNNNNNSASNTHPLALARGSTSPVFSSAPQSPHPNSLCTGFDFGGFSDSTESPLLVSTVGVADTSSPTSFALGAPAVVAISKSSLPSSRISTPSGFSSHLPSTAKTSSHSSEPFSSTSLSSSSAASLPPLPPPLPPAAPIAAGPRAPYRPPHLRARAALSIVSHRNFDSEEQNTPPPRVSSSAPFINSNNNINNSLSGSLTKSLSTPVVSTTTCVPPLLSNSRSVDAVNTRLSAGPIVDAVSSKFSHDSPSSPSTFLLHPAKSLSTLTTTTIPNPGALAETAVSKKRTVLSSISEGLSCCSRGRTTRDVASPFSVNTTNHQLTVTGDTLNTEFDSHSPARSTLRASAPPFVPLARRVQTACAGLNV